MLSIKNNTIIYSAIFKRFPGKRIGKYAAV
jgi:hypothetical protein